MLYPIALIIMLLSTAKAINSRPLIRMTSSSAPRIAIVGGGFGGLYSALKLSKAAAKNNQIQPEIYLFDTKDKFVFLPLLYELAVGSASVLEVAPTYSNLLKGTSIKFIQGRVTSITDKSLAVDTPSETVADAVDTTEYPFDQLVLASGAQPRVDTIPGAADHAVPFSRVEDAYRLKSRLRILSTSDLPVVRVVVIGGGYSGVEVATSVAESLGKDRAVVSLVDRNTCVMHSSPLHNRLTAEKSLLNYGISLNLNSSVARIDADGVVIRETDQAEFKLPADLIILTCGVQPSALVAQIDFLPKDPSGRLLTSRTLQCLGHPHIFALGDCAAIEGVPLPTTAQVAMQQADIVARNLLLSHEANTPLEKFRFVPLGEMLTLGGSLSDASITSLGGLVELEGPLAAIGRRVVYAARMPTVTQAVTAAVNAGIVSIASGISKSSLFGSKRV